MQLSLQKSVNKLTWGKVREMSLKSGFYKGYVIFIM